MTNKEFVLGTMKSYGKMMAKDLQGRSAEMSGTELNAEKVFIPEFAAAIAKMNILDRPIGFVCRTSAGRVVKLLQQYDSTVYTGEPEELPAQWGFKWSKNPKHALPFVAIATSPYNTDECCLGSDGVVYASNVETNTWDPVVVPEYWRAVEVE